MLCRQVVPKNKNDFEQIYIVKSESSSTTTNATDDFSSMEPEDVDIKQETPNEDEHESPVPSTDTVQYKVEDVIIKEEPVEFDDSEYLPIPNTVNLNKDELYTVKKESSAKRPRNFETQDHVSNDNDNENKKEEKSKIGKTSPQPKSKETPNQERFKCHYCPITFTKPFSRTRHEKRHEINMPPEERIQRPPRYPPKNVSVGAEKLREAEANAEIESKKLNLKVIIVNGIKRYQCDFCQKSYTVLSALRRHVNSHTNEKSYACKICGKSYNHPAFLALHEKAHKNTEPHKCEICGREFTVASSLVVHRLLHTDEKTFLCHCGASFIMRNGLNSHLRRCDIPKDLGCCICRFCQTSCPSYAEMVKHVKENHSVDMEDTMCRFCPVKFKDAVQLATHELRHELPGSIKCSECPRIFRNQFYLDLHMKGHKATFMCHVCGKIFPHNVNLRVHRRVHSDNRPHVCEYCSKTFNCSTSIRNHKLTHFNPTSRNYIPGLVDNTSVVIETIDEVVEEIVIEEDIEIDMNSEYIEVNDHLLEESSNSLS